MSTVILFEGKKASRACNSDEEEASATEIAKKKDARGFPANKRAARAGGTVAGNARRELEAASGKKVSTTDIFKQLPGKKTKPPKILRKFVTAKPSL